MKKPPLSLFGKGVLFLLSILPFAEIKSQTAAETSVIIVSCKSGTLIVDGSVIGPVEKDDAIKQNLSYGEHYVQIKSESEKLNLTVAIDQNTKGVIKVGCETSQRQQISRLIDKQIGLSGPIVKEQEENIIGLDKDDKIILNFSVVNKKGTASISIKEINNGMEIFRKERFNAITDEEIKIPIRGIYLITAYTDAIFGKEVKLTLDRVPSPESNPLFNTVVTKVYDTTSIEVLNTVTRVYSVTNRGHSNRSTVALNLPKNTTYWVYWIGVGQETQERMRKFTSAIANIGAKLSPNPLVKFGMRLIPELPMIYSTATVSYRFVDSKNGQAFVSNQAYQYYTFKHSDNISTDYSLVKSYVPDLVLAMNNEHLSEGRDVEVRVVAFVVSSKWQLQ